MMISSPPGRLGAKFFDAVNQAGQHAFGFREAEAAGRQRRAGHRGGVQHARLIFRLHAVRGEQRVDAGFVGVATLARMTF
jgi:hypothetical protein